MPRSSGRDLPWTQSAIGPGLGTVSAVDADRSEGDPFDGWELDEDFVGGASYKEATAKERAAQSRRAAKHQREAERNAQRWRRKQARGQRVAPTDPWADAGRRQPSSGTAKRPWRGIIAVTMIALLLTGNALVRRDGASSTSLFGKNPDAFIVEGVVTEFPSPSDEAREGPIGQPAAAPADGGTYAFIGTQSNGSDPIAYDPCRPIHVVVNERTAPPGGQGLVEKALVDVSVATGLQFILDGKTDEEPVENRSPVNKDRYGDRWSPVLLAWSDPEAEPDLAGDVAGFGGSQQISKDSGDTILVTGTVSLDGPQFVEIMLGRDGEANALAIIRHEIGHLVGLDHVDDRDELMYPESNGSVTDFGRGDRIGLNRLGQGACRSDL